MFWTRLVQRISILGRLGIQPLFGDEAVFSPRKTAGRVRLGSCHWRQQPNVKKVMLNMRIIFSHRGVWRRFMQSCIKSGRFYAVKKHCLEAWSCQGCFLDIVEACVQILNKYERLFTKERQEPSGHADAFTLTCMFVYCGSEEFYGFVSCCCTKSRTSPKLKTFFHWYVFYLLAFRQLMARET